MSRKSDYRAVLNIKHDTINSETAEVISIQKFTLLCAPGLVKFVPAVARLFCLALPGPAWVLLNYVCAE